MAALELFAIIEGVPAGLLWQDGAGLIFFRCANSGPSTYDVLRLLASTGRYAKRNLVAFTKQLFFNCLIQLPHRST